jgi:electron transfer flavoprotein alpha subunit
MAEVLVLVDHVDGEVKKVTLELLTAARALGEPSAVVVGAPGTAGKVKDSLAAYGAAKVYVAESDDAANYLVTPKVDALSSLVEKASPAAVLVAATAEGKEVSGRLAARIGSGLLVDVVGVNADGTVDQSIFGGAFSVKSKVTTGIPVISVRPGGVEAEQADGAAAEEPVDLPATDPAKATKIIGVSPHHFGA